MKTKFRFTTVIMVLMAFVLTSFSSCEKDDVDEPQIVWEFPQELLGYWVIDELITPQGGTLTCENQGTGQYIGALVNWEFKHDSNNFQRANIYGCSSNQFLSGHEFYYDKNEKTIKFGLQHVIILELTNENLVVEYIEIENHSQYSGSIAYYHKR